MKPWIEAWQQCLKQEQACILVTQAAARGSVPQHCGAKLIVTRTSQWGTIGGGQLEFHALQQARDALADPQAQVSWTENCNLGARVGQCCGGEVRLVYQKMDRTDPALDQLWFCLTEAESHQGLLLSLLEPRGRVPQVIEKPALIAGLSGETFTGVSQFLQNPHRQVLLFTEQGQHWMLEKLANDAPNLLLFGAGHVGQAVARALAPLAFKVNWVDSRFDEMVGADFKDIRFVQSGDPLYEVNQAPVDAWYLVMTHDHAQDFDIVQAILKRSDFYHLGMIGSETKRRRFHRRLLARGFTTEQLSRMQCPIGISGIHSKQPEAIAVSVAADLLRRRQRQLLHCSENLLSSDGVACRGAQRT